MKEVFIPIELANAVDFYGINDSNLELIRNRFPGLKIIPRGNELKIIGDEIQIEVLYEKLNLLINHFEQSGHLTIEEVKRLLNGSAVKPQSDDSKTEPILYGPQGSVIRARTVNQVKMVQSIMQNDIVFAIGPAGTGKTYTAVALAVRALKNKEIKRIILTRPAVEAGENLGFLPGDLKEKIDPYLGPLYDALYDMIPGEKLRTLIENNIIEVAPLAFMRGRTLDNAFVILDEAQNASSLQLKMFLTRMGPSAKFILTGDVTQIDLPQRQPSGLPHALSILKGIEGIGFVWLDENDVVRHKIVKEIIKAYS
ncbi:MAG: PhoH family protein [Bacteroidia bacterium]|nr:PhoH family protein [Bacteroidia bacterium]MCZ2277665.1 PhoH family protein [Bacteroidia bacterium]